MKSLITLHFEGTCITNPSPNHIIHIWINEKLHTYDNLKPQILIWDHQPWRADVLVRIEVQNTPSSSIFTTTKSKVPLDKYLYRFRREINHKTHINADREFILPNNTSFKHTLVECSTSDFTIIPTDPILRTSPLCFFPEPFAITNMDLLMRDWNKSQIAAARLVKDLAHVHLLRITHITDKGFYYETFLKRLEKLGTANKDEKPPNLENEPRKTSNYDGLELISFD